MGTTDRTGGIGRRLFGAFVDRQTYKNLLYLLLAIPLGFAYYALFGMGVLVGVFLTLVLVGLVVLVGLLLGARAAAAFERWLANALLGLDLRGYDDVGWVEGAGLRARLRAYLDAPSTWRAVGFLSMKTLLSVLSILGLFVLATAASMLTAPLRYPTAVEFGEVNGDPLTWSIETVPEALAAGLFGAALLVLFVHLANAVAYVCGRIAAALLGDSSSAV